MKVLVVMATWWVAGTQGRALAVCLSPGIWTTSEHEPGWPRGSQGCPSCSGPTRAGRTMTTSPPPWQHLLPGPPLVAPLSCTCCPPTTPAPQLRRPPQGTPCLAPGPAACSEGQPRGVVEPGWVAGRALGKGRGSSCQISSAQPVVCVPMTRPPLQDLILLTCKVEATIPALRASFCLEDLKPGCHQSWLRVDS